MVQVTEGTFEVAGAKLHTKTWLPDDGPIKAKMIMIHGFSDHIDRYYDFFPSLARRSIAVYGFDQRGWGKSALKPAERGNTGPTDRVLADMAAFITAKMAEGPASDAPVFVLGHSMGGGQVATLASSQQYAELVGKLRGFILESPFIGFAPELKPSWLLVTSGRMGAKIMPGFQMKNFIPPEHVSRRVDVQESIRGDELLHYTGTLQGLSGLLDRTANLSEGKVKLLPSVKSLLLVHGTDDKATCFDESKKWFDRHTLEDGEFKAYNGMYHQMHADDGQEEFYQHVGDWILARCGNPEAKL